MTSLITKIEKSGIDVFIVITFEFDIEEYINITMETWK